MGFRSDLARQFPAGWWRRAAWWKTVLKEESLAALRLLLPVLLLGAWRRAWKYRGEPLVLYSCGPRGQWVTSVLVQLGAIVWVGVWLLQLAVLNEPARWPTGILWLVLCVGGANFTVAYGVMSLQLASSRGHRRLWRALDGLPRWLPHPQEPPQTELEYRARHLQELVDTRLAELSAHHRR